jgi:AbrB family looped-hinge helix DNA binding protein
MLISRIRRRGRITLPGLIRSWLRLQEGDRVAFVRRGNEVVLRPLTHTLLEMRGSVVPASGPHDSSAVRRQVRNMQTEKVATNES